MADREARNHTECTDQKQTNTSHGMVSRRGQVSARQERGDAHTTSQSANRPSATYTRTQMAGLHAIFRMLMVCNASAMGFVVAPVGRPWSPFFCVFRLVAVALNPSHCLCNIPTTASPHRTTSLSQANHHVRLHLLANQTYI